MADIAPLGLLTLGPNRGTPVPDITVGPAILFSSKLGPLLMIPMPSLLEEVSFHPLVIGPILYPAFFNKLFKSI